MIKSLITTNRKMSYKWWIYLLVQLCFLYIPEVSVQYTVQALKLQLKIKTQQFKNGV